MGIVAHCEIQEKHLDRNDGFKAFRFSLAVAADSPLESFLAETPMTSDAAQEPDSGKSRLRYPNDRC